VFENWVFGNWDVGAAEKFIVNMGKNISNNKNSPLKTTFHYSMFGANTSGTKSPS
jgi:hypothetical protein